VKPIARILVAGIGNIFLGDDAFGSEVAQRLMRQMLGLGVEVMDLGIRSLDLMYALIDGYDAAILIAAVPRGEPPGTLFLIEPRIDAPADADATCVMLDGHTMDPVKVLRAAGSMGMLPRRLLIVGCEPTPLPGDEEMQMEMSSPVSAAIDEAVSMVCEIVSSLRAGRSDNLADKLDERVVTADQISAPPAHAAAQK
jgi:hydrogenase maturation protease